MRWLAWNLAAALLLPLVIVGWILLVVGCLLDSDGTVQAARWVVKPQLIAGHRAGWG